MMVDPERQPALGAARHQGRVRHRRQARKARRQAPDVRDPCRFPISARSSTISGATATSSRSTRRSTRVSKRRRSIAASSPPAGRRCCSPNVTGASFPLVTNLFGTARRAELAFGERPLALMKRLVARGRDDPAADAGQAVGRARRRRGELLKVGYARRDAGRSRRSSTATCASIGCRRITVLAGGRRPVHHAAARLHAHPGRQGPQPRHVPPARARRAARRACTGRSARAAASTTRWPRRAASRCR